MCHLLFKLPTFIYRMVSQTVEALVGYPASPRGGCFLMPQEEVESLFLNITNFVCFEVSYSTTNVDIYVCCIVMKEYVFTISSIACPTYWLDSACISVITNRYHITKATDVAINKDLLTAVICHLFYF